MSNVVARRLGNGTDAPEQVRTPGRPLEETADLHRFVERSAGARSVGIGEASHGTHGYDERRAPLSRGFIGEHGVTWTGLPADQPVGAGQTDRDLDARGPLAALGRWPTWTWGNEEVAGFLDRPRLENAHRPAHERVGFYGPDVHPLREIITGPEDHAPQARAAPRQA